MESLDSILTIFASLITPLMLWDSYKTNPKDKKVNVRVTIIVLFLLFVPISIFAYYSYGIKKSPATFEFLVTLLKYFWIGVSILCLVDRYIFKNRLSKYPKED